MGQAAARMAAFCEALPELGSDVMGVLMSSNPAIVATPPQEASHSYLSGFYEPSQSVETSAFNSDIFQHSIPISLCLVLRHTGMVIFLLGSYKARGHCRGPGSGSVSGG